MGLFDSLFDVLFGETKDLGKYGETLTERELDSFWVDGYHRILKNVYVPLYGGKFTEVDLIMIHMSGVFVVESKNYSGWIFGSADQKYWTQCLNKNTKHRFYNPIMQNQTHINALSRFLRLDKEKFTSFIVFSNRCELKNVPESTDNCKILQRDFLVGRLNSKINANSFFTGDEVDAIYRRLEPLTNQSEDVRRQHAERIGLLNQKKASGI